MTKSQKIWLWVFIAMFAIPEILWSPVLNFVYTFYKGGNIPTIFRNNFLMQNDYRIFAIIVLLLQTVGAFLASILVTRLSIEPKKRVVLFVVFFVLFLFAFFVSAVLLMTYNISFI